MKKTNRMLALVMSLMLCVSLLPGQAFAEEEADFSQAEISEELPYEEPESTEVPSTETEAERPEYGPAAEEKPVDVPEEDVSNDACYTASNDYEIQVTGTYHQTQARSMLASINDFRTGDEAWYWATNDTTDDSNKVYCSGLSALTYDYTLEKDAMQRAAELAVYYSHTRPNGDKCFSVRTGSYSYAGENIAYGGNCVTTANEAFTLWKEDNYGYSGQGHRRNMLSSRYNRVGIACYQYNYSIDYTFYYWVQEFSCTSDENDATIANDSVTVVDIYMNSSLISSVTLNASPKSYDLSVGESSSVPEITAKAIINDSACSSWNEYSATFKVVSPSFAVSDTTVANVSENFLTGLKNGSTSLICNAMGSSITIPVTVTGVEHSYGALVFSWADDLSACTATFTCSSCGDKQVLNAEITSVVDTSATCTEAGSALYTATVIFNDETYTDTNRQNIPALGHDWGEWYLDRNTGFWVRDCSRCSETDVGIEAGNCDNNEVVDLRDLLVLKQALAGDDFIRLCRGADVNGDNAINLQDLLVLKNMLANK